MHAPLTLEEMTCLAKQAWLEASEEPELSRAALIWTLLNRRRQCADGARQAIGEGAVPAEAVACSPSDLRFHDPAFCQAFATVCLVCGGHLEDPTHGATRYHAHDELPGWARSLQPLALIGPRFFY